jgi:hypothetical protein
VWYYRPQSGTAGALRVVDDEMRKTVPSFAIIISLILVALLVIQEPVAVGRNPG